MAIIETTMWKLWSAYSGNLESGRVECPVTVRQNRHPNSLAFEATHIYCGYGKIRLERIEGTPQKKKGFQGIGCPLGNKDGRIFIED